MTRSLLIATRSLLVVLIAASAFALTADRVAAQVKDDQAAAMLLNSARKAFNEKNYPFAAARFREFISRFGGRKEAASARYGLALALLDSPERNFDEARNLLQALANDGNFADRHLARYYLAVAVRSQGLKELSEGEARPNEMAQRRANAQRRFEEALPFFSAALTAFTDQAKNVKVEGKTVPLVVEWSARARCDLAEMQVRLSRAKDARGTAEPFVKDAVLSLSRYRDLGRYLHGYACLLLKDYPAAEKSLTLLAPFRPSSFASHARYLLARTHHLQDERTEALALYEAAVSEYQKSKDAAVNRLKQPNALKDNPTERFRLEALVRNPPPEHVGRSQFYLGVLKYEAGRFAEARAHYQEMLKQHPQTPLRTEAELRIGFCQVQQKEYAQAQKTLQPLIDRDQRLSDQVLFWLAKAQAGAAPDVTVNASGHQQAINNAMNTLRQANDRAQRIENQDPEAKVRRAEIMFELADLMQAVKQHREAANLYGQLQNDKALHDRREELAQRRAAALHLAGDHNASDQACEQFFKQFPQSTLTPAVMFTFGENSFFRIAQAEKNTNAAERTKQIAKYAKDAIERFEKLIAKYPEEPRVHVARYSVGLTYYRQGDLAKAQKALAEIPDTERAGALRLVPYLLADCTLREVPTTIPDDALGAGKMEEQLKSAATLLAAFVGAQPKAAETPDALLKLGLTQQRLAALLAQPPEKAKALAEARAVYERITREYGSHPSAAQAVLERAKCIAQSGDINQATNELRRFLTPPLKDAPAAPMALIQLATYLRTQNRAAEASELLSKARGQYEGKLASDPERSHWVTLLQYHHGVCLRAAGKLPEARAALDGVVKNAKSRPEAAEAALRFGQCLKDEGQKKLDQAQKLRSSGKKEERAQAQGHDEQGARQLREAASYLEGQAAQLNGKEGRQDVRARMIYEAAWASRAVGELEMAAARAKMAQALAKKLGPAAAKFAPPPIPRAKVPVQPAEKKSFDLYGTLVGEFGELPIATEARFELAELHARRGGHEPALKLLNEVLDKEPSPELTEKVRLRMGAVHAARGDLKAALAQFDAVAANPKSSLLGWAHYRAGEALLQAERTADAIKRLQPFRDGPLQNVAGVSDRALLRLGQAYAAQENWDASRQALERLAGSFPNSPWIDEGRYGIGWAQQQQKNFDGAVNTYAQVTAHTATEVAARAQLQMGLCRLEQKRYAEAATALMVVPYTYDYPELTAAALLEASRAYAALRQPDQAQRALNRLLRDYPDTPWAEAARERLGNLRAN